MTITKNIVNNKFKIFNTLTSKVEVFKPINSNIVKMYSCGPTVYSSPHIGNMRAYVLTDLIKRALTLSGYKVLNAINITDVGHLTDDLDNGDDKIDIEAKKNNTTSHEISKKYYDMFARYLSDLGISSADYHPFATEYILEQIQMIIELENLGYTYKLSDGIYYDTSKFPSYCELGNINKEGLTEGFRVNFKGKKNVTDFALWKFSPSDSKRDMEWNSPWGVGFPGWHIECSAMARTLFGDQIDIHTGGIDHIHVHHSNEIAQIEPITGKKFVNYWVHVNFLNILNPDNKLVPLKMSKSLDNFVTLDSLYKDGFSAMDLKFYYMNSHYRSQISYHKDYLKEIQTFLNRIRIKVEEIKVSLKGLDLSDFEDSDALTLIKNAFFNDLNTPVVISELTLALKNENLSNKQKYKIIQFVDDALGFDLLSYEIKKETIPEHIIELAEKRKSARLENDWILSDYIRLEINSLNYEIKDVNKYEYELKKII